MRIITFARPNLGCRELLSVLGVLRSGMLSQGEKVEEFENRFSEPHKAIYGVAVNSGTSALHLSLLAMGIGPGDEVIVPAITFGATANAVAMTGGMPVIADIDDKTFNLSLKSASSLLSKRTKAVIPVELFGNPVDIDEWARFAAEHGLKLIFDCSQSHLASDFSSLSENFEFAATYSFYPTKNMTTGEGGIVLTNNNKVAHSIRLLRNQGMSDTYVYERHGLNNRMTEIAASIGLGQLRRLHKFTKHRQKIAEIYNQKLRGAQLQERDGPGQHVYHQYTVLLQQDRDWIVSKLKELGIPTRIFYPAPLHRIKPFSSQKSLKIAEDFSRRCISLPIGPHISTRYANKIGSKLSLLLGEKNDC